MGDALKGLEPAIERMVEVAVRVGCPADQIENFLAAGYIPQPKQLEFHAAARSCDASEGPDEVGFGGARGPGKSHAIFSQLALDDCQRFPGLKGLYLRKSAKQAREQFDDLRRAVLQDMPHEYSRSGVLRFPNGSQVFIGNFKDEGDVDKYLGIEYDVIVLEETTTFTESKYRALRDSNRTAKFGWRPRMYNSTNPGGVGHTWYKRRFIDPMKRGERGYTRFIPATVDDNQFLDSDYRRKLEENVGWKLRAHRYGEWDIAIGQYFETWSDRFHVRHETTMPEAWKLDWPIWMGFDYGYVHWTMAYLLTMDPEHDMVYVLDEYAGRRMQVAENADGIRRMVERNRLRLERVHPMGAGSDVFARRGDSSGLTIAEQYALYGIYLVQSDMDRVNGAAELVKLLGNPYLQDEDANDDVVSISPPRLVVSSRCLRLIDCIPSLVHDPIRREDVKKVDCDEEGLGGDDPYDALRYGIMVQGIGAEASHAIEPEDAVIAYDATGWRHEDSFFADDDRGGGWKAESMRGRDEWMKDEGGVTFL